MKRLALLALVGLAIMGVAQFSAVLAYFEDYNSHEDGTPVASLTTPGVTYASSGPWAKQTLAMGCYILGDEQRLYDHESDATLVMTFAEPQQTVSFVFSTVPDAAVGVQGYKAGVLVIDTTFSSSGIGGCFWEGTAQINAVVDEVRVSPLGSVDFGLDNLSTTVAADPPQSAELPTPVRAPVPGPDLVPIPDQAVGGTFTMTTPIYWAPRADAVSTTVMEAGKSVWVYGLDESESYYQVMLAGKLFWVPVGTIGPNYDEVWQGTPLPVEMVEEPSSSSASQLQ